jgi:NO-binding membrane sensor protein with MHYT domain
VEHLQHFFQYGPVTAVVAYAMACVGAGLALRCVARGVQNSGVTKHSWLLIAATALGAAVWTMHLITMLGFSIDGTPVRYDVLLTLLGLLVAVAVVGTGIFALGYSRASPAGIVLGGIGIGAGIAAMHYIGMAAMRIHGTLTYELPLVITSAVIAVGGSTIGLWLAVRSQTVRGSIGAALILGAAALGTELAGLAATRIELIPGTSVLPGASATEFVLPFIIVFGSFLFLSSAFVALSPAKQHRAAAATAGTRQGHDSQIAS